MHHAILFKYKSKFNVFQQYLAYSLWTKFDSVTLSASILVLYDLMHSMALITLLLASTMHS